MEDAAVLEVGDFVWSVEADRCLELGGAGGDGDGFSLAVLEVSDVDYLFAGQA